jgi:hypothetical protein
VDHIELTRIPLHARRTAVARHDVSPHVLDILADDPDDSVRMAVASHPSTSLESLCRLANDVVARVAGRARLRALALGNLAD